MKRTFQAASSSPYPLSRTRVELFLQCPRCFYLQERLGISRPSWPGFPLNVAVDTLLKKEFDACRAKGEPHPLMKTYGLKAVPFQHPMMDEWRKNFKGVRWHHLPTNLIIYGAVDDIWEDEDGSLIVVDYKATSTSEPITLDSKYREPYKRQIEMYQWLLRQNGFKVSPVGYFVYANGEKDRQTFDGRLEFKVELIPYQGEDSWIEKKIKELYLCLKGSALPEADKDCEHCLYHQKLKEVEQNVSSSNV